MQFENVAADVEVRSHNPIATLSCMTDEGVADLSPILSGRTFGVDVKVWNSVPQGHARHPESVDRLQFV